MLRTVRSLPSLRLFSQTQESHISSAGALFAAKPAQPTTSTFSRNVHSTSSKKTILLDTPTSKYTSMNLNGLKMECKKRGLKVSGRKLELVQRLVQLDASQSGAANGRSFGTTAEGIKIPSDDAFLILENSKRQIKKSEQLAEIKKRANEIEQTKIKLESTRPSPLAQVKPINNTSLKTTKKVIVYTKENSERKTTSQINSLVKAREISLKAIQASAVLTKAATESAVKSSIVEQARAHLQTKATETKSEKKQEHEKKSEQKQHSSQENTDLSSRDKLFLTGFGLGTVGWWSMGS